MNFERCGFLVAWFLGRAPPRVLLKRVQKKIKKREDGERIAVYSSYNESDREQEQTCSVTSIVRILKKDRSDTFFDKHNRRQIAVV